MSKENLKSLYREDGINKNTYDLLFKDYDNLSDDEIMKQDVFKAWLTIQKFTMLQHKKILFGLAKIVLKNKEIDLNDIQYDKENNEYIYIHEDKKYTFDILSNYVEGKENIKELQSDKRYGECHSRSVAVAANMEDSKIVSGYVTIGDKKYLHSIVVKQNSKGIIEALDWTQNVIMPYDQYKNIHQFEELAEVDSEVILDDLKNVLKGLNLGIKPYLFFRDELIKDTKRNEEIFYKK